MQDGSIYLIVFDYRSKNSVFLSCIMLSCWKASNCLGMNLGPNLHWDERGLCPSTHWRAGPYAWKLENILLGRPFNNWSLYPIHILNVNHITYNHLGRYTISTDHSRFMRMWDSNAQPFCTVTYLYLQCWKCSSFSQQERYQPWDFSFKV